MDCKLYLSLIGKPARGLLSFLTVFVMVFTLSITGCTSSSTDSALSVSNATSSDTAKIGERVDELEVVANLPPPPTEDGRASAPISENDLLEISVFQVKDLDRTVRVDANGNISMPLIGLVQAAKLTVPQLEQSLEARYNSNYLQSSDISVFVKESFGQRVTMDGEFIKPGIYPITSQTTLLQTVAQAGGMSDLADEKKIFVYRNYGETKKVANYSISDIRAGKKADPTIYGGDVVVAFTSKAKIGAKNLREALGLATSAVRVAAPL